MKMIGEVEIEEFNREDIELLVNLFERLKEINEKIDELEKICKSLVNGAGDSRV